MKCEKVKQHIDQYFIENLRELDPDTGLHIDGCYDCRMYFQTHEKAEELITDLHEFEPVLIDPEGLTEDIMMALDNAATTLEPGDKITPANISLCLIQERIRNGLL